MIPEVNSHVQLFFRNGLREEGIVISWSDKQSVLKYLTTDSVFIIQNTLADVMAIKIFAYENKKPAKPKVFVEEVPIGIDKTISTVYKPRQENPDLRTMKLVDLHLLKTQVERERARELMTTFTAPGSLSIEDHYGTPTRLQKPPSFNTRKKDK